MNKFATWLSKEMSTRNIGSTELANRIAYSQGFISKLATGKKNPPSPHRTDLYKALSDEFNVQETFLEKLVTEGTVNV